MTNAKAKLPARKRPAAKTAKAGAVSRKAGTTGDHPGGEVLNKAAQKALTKNSGKIAESLLRGTLGGSSSNVKVLVGLADEPAAEAKPAAKGDFVSQALRLASEPEWGAKDSEAAGRNETR
jgi:hypothetical protein